MNNMPIIRLEIERLRHSVTNVMLDSNNEINAIISESLNKQLTEGWVMQEIDLAVKECLKEAIKGIANSYQLRNAITESISNVIVDKLNASVSS